MSLKQVVKSADNHDDCARIIRAFNTVNNCIVEGLPVACQAKDLAIYHYLKRELKASVVRH